MNLKQAEIILEKITRLYKSMKLDERNIDVFEQDLMLSYIRQLHESFSPNKPVSKRKKTTLPPIEESVVPIAKEPIKAPPTPKPVESKAPPKVVEVPKETEAPKIIEKPKAAKPPRIITPPVIKEVPKPTPAPTPPPPPSPPKPQAVPATGGLSPAEIIGLFEVKEATELSEKLSMAPIRDLSKAMGLNEKIFTINELFGGESKVFDETVKKLNTFGSFETAKAYLAAGVAHTYNWTNRSKKKKAINFINLVKRRYN